MEYHQATGGLIEMMSTDSDPRFRNSKFLDFLKKVQTGEYELKDNQLITHPEKAKTQPPKTCPYHAKMEAAFDVAAGQETQNLAKEEMMENAFVQARNKVEVEDLKMNSMENQFQDATKEVEQDIEARMKKRAEQIQQMWTEMARNYDPDNPELVEKLNQKWEGLLEEWNEDRLSEHWQVAQDLQEAQNLVPGEYRPSRGPNQYLNANNPHRIFIDLYNKGETGGCIKALEAHLNKHPQDHTGWRMLGVLLQENDQDNESIPAFLKAIRIEPNCREALFQLGVSCTNVLDEVTSMMYLQRWLKTHPEWLKVAGVSSLNSIFVEFQSQKFIF